MGRFCLLYEAHTATTTRTSWLKERHGLVVTSEHHLYISFSFSNSRLRVSLPVLSMRQIYSRLPTITTYIRSKRPRPTALRSVIFPARQHESARRAPSLYHFHAAQTRGRAGIIEEESSIVWPMKQSMVPGVLSPRLLPGYSLPCSGWCLGRA